MSKVVVSEAEILRCLFDLYGYDTATGSGGLLPIPIKNGPGQLFGWYIFNNTAAVAYANFYNVQASTVNPGVTAPFLSFGIPSGLGANILSVRGINFPKMMSLNFSTLRGGSVAPAATIDYNVWFDLRTRKC